MFYRRATDGTRLQIPLENLYAGPVRTACWIIGGGPSLSQLASERIVGTAAPRFTINLAGSGLLRPQFWTSYDPTARFHRSIYLDPAVTKFVHEGRAMDLVPETTFKVCDCPSLYFIDREPGRGFQEFPGTGRSAITDWQDSLIQAIEIAFRLGFRELYLAGCEMWISPSKQLIRAAKTRGVLYQKRGLLGDFVRRCERAGLPREEIEALSTGPQYHFVESKSLTAACQTDAHYFRVAQTLRLCRRSMALAGLQLISVTPGSRLNDDFPVWSLDRACCRIHKVTGDPQHERTQGRYSETQNRHPQKLGPMRDVRPHFWPAETKAPPAKEISPPATARITPPTDLKIRLKKQLDDLPEIAVDLNEQGE